MAIFKRGKTWWVSFTGPSGQRVRQTTGTSDRKAALEFHDRLKTECWRVEKLGDKPRRTWQEAVKRWLEETTHKASRRDDIKIFRRLHLFLANKCLDNIDRDMIDEMIEQRKNDGVTNATINRLLALLRSVLKRAVQDWEWIDKIPVIKLLPEAKKRVRWLIQEEANRLLKELPEHLAEMTRFTLATGLRERNVTYLEWSQVDVGRKCAWIHPDQAKTRKAIAVPLNDEAIAVLRRQIGKHLHRVFTFRGKPVDRACNHAWLKALKRSGIENFRWHDLRHTWATWHIQNGTPLYVLQELGGWSSYEMVKRYAIFRWNIWLSMQIR